MCQLSSCKRFWIVWFVHGFIFNSLAFFALALVGSTYVQPLAQMSTSGSPSSAMCSFLMLSQIAVGGKTFIWVTLFAFKFFAGVALGMLPH